MASTPERSADPSVRGPDPAWRGFYRAGGLAAILYVVLSLGAPAAIVLATDFDFELEGAEYLAYISQNQVMWLTVQTLVLGSSILAIVAFVAIFLALKHVNRTYALLGTVVAITVQILFVAYYPVLLGMSYLSDRFVVAGASQRAVYATAAEALVAMNGAFNPLYESVFAVGILLVSVAMLGGVFSRWIAYLGVATTLSAFVALPLWPIVGIGYFWWWAFFAVWFVAIGWQLLRLGSRSAETTAPEAVYPARR